MNNSLPYLPSNHQLKTLKGIIYRITNRVNGKVYIGKTINSFYKRYVNGKWWEYSSNELLKKDVLLFGKESFYIEFLAENLSNNILSQLEVNLILSHNSISPNGYNNILIARDTTIVSENSRRKMSISQKAVPYERTLKRMAKMKGFRHTEESKRKIGLASKIRGNSHSNRPVEQIDIQTNQIVAKFDSIKQAHEQTGIVYDCIIRCCSNKLKLAGGYKWRHVFSYPQRKNTKPTVPVNRRPVLQIDIKTKEVLYEYPSLTEAAQAVKLKNKANICDVCRGRTKSSQGFFWQYKDTNETT